MIDTFFSRGACSTVVRALRRGAECLGGSEAGDTLIEVLLSALMLGLVVVGTLTGLNSANRVTSLDRERSQADALAQQDEDRLRSEPVNKLSELSVTHTAQLHEVNAAGTKYSITSTAKYISDETATSSCNSTTPEANYIQTSSQVTWTSLENAHGKPVVETSIVSPPASSALIVQVTGASGEAVPEMNVVATGPTNISTKTSTDGCAIMAVSPGEYTLNVSRSEYVDKNGYANSDEDSISNQSLYVVAEETVKKDYEFAKAGKLKVRFENPVTKLPTEGDSFVAASNLMTAYKTFTTKPTGTYEPIVESSTPNSIFPFTNNYTVYAGTCESDLPPASITGNPTYEKNFSVKVPSGETGEITTLEPPVNIKVMSGTASGSLTEGTAVTNATGSTTDACGVKRSFTSTPLGALPHPNLPFGTYSMCVSESTGTKKRWEGTFENNSVTGPSTSTPWTNGGFNSEKQAVIYLGAATKTGACP